MTKVSLSECGKMSQSTAFYSISTAYVNIQTNFQPCAESRIRKLKNAKPKYLIGNPVATGGGGRARGINPLKVEVEVEG